MGIADFIGGLEARRLPVLSVLLLSQPVGLAVAAIWALSAGASARPRLPGRGGRRRRRRCTGARGAVCGDGARHDRPGIADQRDRRARAGRLRPGARRVAERVAAGQRRARDRRRPLGRTAVTADRGAGKARWAERPVRRRCRTWLRCLCVGVSFAAKHNVTWSVCAVPAGGCGMIVAGSLIARRPVRAREFDRPWLATIGALDVVGSVLYALATTLGRVSLSRGRPPCTRRDPRRTRRARAPRTRPTHRSRLTLLGIAAGG